jgi:hypothetical protein
MQAHLQNAQRIALHVQLVILGEICRLQSNALLGVLLFAQLLLAAPNRHALLSTIWTSKKGLLL